MENGAATNRQKGARVKSLCELPEMYSLDSCCQTGECVRQVGGKSELRAQVTRDPCSKSPKANHVNPGQDAILNSQGIQSLGSSASTSQDALLGSHGPQQPHEGPTATGDRVLDLWRPPCNGILP